MAVSPKLRITEIDQSATPGTSATGLYAYVGAFPNGPFNNPEEIFITPERFLQVYGYMGSQEIPEDSSPETENLIHCYRALKEGARLRISRVETKIPSGANPDASLIPTLPASVNLIIEADDWDAAKAAALIIEFTWVLKTDGSSAATVVSLDPGWTEEDLNKQITYKLYEATNFGITYPAIPDYISTDYTQNIALKISGVIDFTSSVTSSDGNVTINTVYEDDVIFIGSNFNYPDKMKMSLKSAAAIPPGKVLGIAVKELGYESYNFIIGLADLNPNGSVQLDKFQPIEVYQLNTRNKTILNDQISTINETSNIIENFWLTNWPDFSNNYGRIKIIAALDYTRVVAGEINYTQFRNSLEIYNNYEDITDIITGRVPNEDAIVYDEGIVSYMFDFVDEREDLVLHIFPNNIEEPIVLPDIEDDYDSSFMAKWGPKIEQLHPQTGNRLTLNLQGAVLNALTITDSSEYGPWYVPGGQTRGKIRNAVAVNPNFGAPGKATEFEILAQFQYNLAIKQAGNILLMGNYTTRKGVYQDQSESTLNFLNARRFINHLKKELKPIFQRMLLEPNDIPLWFKTFLDIQPLLDGFVTKRALYSWEYYGDQLAASLDTLTVNNKQDVLQGKYKAKLGIEVIPGLLQVDLEIIISNGLIQING